MDNWAMHWVNSYGGKGNSLLEHVVFCMQEHICWLKTPCAWPPINYAYNRRWQLDGIGIDWWD